MRRLLHLLAFALPAITVTTAIADEGPGGRTTEVLFPFCHDTHDAKQRSPEEQAALVKELGFDGLGHLWLNDVPTRLKTLDTAGLKLYWIHTTINLTPDKPAYDSQLLKVLPLLKGRNALLSLNIVGRPSSDQAFDPQAVEILRALSDGAAESEVRIVLYHHLNDWTERFADCLRVAEKVDRENVGVMFNLCHWSRIDDEASLHPLLVAALPRLFCVAINGSDRPADLQAGRGQFIQPLGRGDFDVRGLVKLLRELGYEGSYGLMCYGLKGDAREHLTQSMKSWQEMRLP